MTDRSNLLPCIQTALILLLLVMTSAAGCAPTLNHTYQRLDSVPDGKAIVYLYRPPFMGWTFAVDVSVNTEPVNSIYTSTYYPYITQPGSTEFMFDAPLIPQKPFSMEFKPGASYYLKIRVVPKAIGAELQILQIPKLEAEAEMAEFKQLRDLSK